MNILSFKPGHDGTVAFIADGTVRFSLEAEKDGFPRYSAVTPTTLIKALSLMDQPPDVVCISGWVKGFHSVEPSLNAGYFGWGESTIETGKSTFLGRETVVFSSTHERSHLLSSYGLSSLPQGSPCYALVWEGNIGSFYSIDESVRVRRLLSVMEDPGNKYSFLFGLADPSYPADSLGVFRFENAGKLMALTGYGRSGPPTPSESSLIDDILGRRAIILTTAKSEYQKTKYYDVGVENPAFTTLAARFSEELFSRFLEAATEVCTERWPLLISGGCGLNCDWNSRWRSSGLFETVFVPPCTNDTGSAIGTALDAQLLLTGNAKASWSVYSGEEFEHNLDPEGRGFRATNADPTDVARLLKAGNVFGWVQGRCEMGPRALGNRSIIGAPFDQATRDRLNKIKQRDNYRPIAPVCLEEDVSRHFDWEGPSPHMLYFQRVTDRRLLAITHVDGSARVQTVRPDQNAPLYRLISAFKAVSGVGVLCNTSLNCKGRGFINNTRDLVEYTDRQGLDGFVIGDVLYRVAR